jgi:RNA polymerase sigma-70 factor (ECF subfamily)
MFRRNYARLSEQALVVRAQSGDRAAFEELYRRFGGKIYALVFGMVGNTDDAAELSQEVFVRAFRSLSALRADQAVYGWLRATATHLAIDFIRHGKLVRFEPLDGGEPEAGHPAAREQGPERQLERKERQAAVVEAVASLKPAHRMVVTLHHLEGLSVEEVAEALGIPVGTVKSRLARARDALRVVLAPYVEGRS